MQDHLNTLIRRICDITDQDRKYKADNTCHSSLVEELGECARELKIEESIRGNTYKSIDEGSLAESVDVFICIIHEMHAYYMSIPHYDINRFLKLDTEQVKREFFRRPGYGIFDLFNRLSADANSNLNNAVFTCISFFILRGGNYKIFLDILNKKLDKWQKNNAS